MSTNADWSEGYVHDLVHADNSFAELTPAHLNYVAIPRALDRVVHLLQARLRHGQTVTVLAAGNPNGRFFACDIDPTHVQAARRWIEAESVVNLTVLEASFAQMIAADLPDLDFIVLHGVYS